MKIYCEHTIPMSAELFWQHIHDPRYEAMVGRVANLDEYATLERRDEPDAIYRKIKVVPQIPAQFQAILSKVAASVDKNYTEEQWRSKSRKAIRWKISLGVLGDKARFEGEVRIEPINTTSCKRILDGDITVKIFGVGGLIEKAIVSQTVEAYGKSAAVAGDYARQYGIS